MLLAGGLQVACLLVLVAPEILGRGSIIPLFEQRYMLVPPSPPGGWCSFAQAPGPSQGPGYAPGTSDGAGPSIGPFAGSNDSDDSNTDQFIGGEDS